MTEIKKILIANRGEIAMRVIETCREMDIETITIYTSSEKGLPHTYAGDQAVCLGSGALSETYLNQKLIIDIAKENGAHAIHPGYGFLSENAAFAKQVRSAGLIFIGPNEEAITLMGDKKESKKKMEEMGAPLIPGYHGDDQDPNLLAQKANEMGFPVLIKASAGGGGKGMRAVQNASEFAESLEAAKREAQNAFGNDIVLIEKYILSPRHIEIQIMSDSHGNHLHLFERECSIQRRHQKIVEETPSPALTPQLREEMANSAVSIAKCINYLGAGTVEYILDEDNKFYFLEMNTRLQVEHPVTEMVTGFDLVRMQIQVAAGEKLETIQENISQRGHAIEVRLYAEDPDKNFMPSIGNIITVGNPSLRETRLDSGYADGNDVTVDFDPMLAKLIAWGPDRDTAIKKLQDSLEEVVFLGIKTNREYLSRVLSSKEFKSGKVDTHFVETYKEQLLPADVEPKTLAHAIALRLLVNQKAHISKTGNHSKDGLAWDNLGNFRNT